MGQDGECHEVVVHFLLKIMEERVGKNSFWKAVPAGKERREKRGTKQLRCSVSLDLGSLTKRGLLEECVYPGMDRKGQGIERAEGAVSQQRRYKLERPLIYL